MEELNNENNENQVNEAESVESLKAKVASLEKNLENERKNCEYYREAYCNAVDDKMMLKKVISTLKPMLSGYSAEYLLDKISKL